MIDAAELTLDELAVALAPAIADSAVFDGWSDDAVAAAAQSEGVDPDVAALAYPAGAMDMIEAWVTAIDRRMADELSAPALAAMPVGKQVHEQLVFRLRETASQREALRRALAVMAMPKNVARSARLGWRTADLIWRLAGDTTTDLNHYSKRAILASIYAATLNVFAQDDSEGQVDTYAFLDRRLDDIARFGKARARWSNPERERFSLTRMLGRLRYPAR